MRTYNRELEMTEAQQNKVAMFFDSANKQKRDFAIGSVKNINDIDTLSEAHSKLERKQEKKNFPSYLIAAHKSEAQFALARELAASSDDPLIRRLEPKN